MHRRARRNGCRPGATCQYRHGSGRPRHRIPPATQHPVGEGARLASSRHRPATAPICTTRSPKSMSARAALEHVRLQDESQTAFHLSTIYAEIAERWHLRQFPADHRRARVTQRNARASGRPRARRASERCAASARRPTCRLHLGRAPRCTALRIAPDSEERADRSLARGVPGPHRGGPHRAEDRRLSDEPVPAAVTGRRDRYQAGAGDLRRRREMQPWRHSGELDPAQLFYLRTRGIPEAEARSILVRAFLAEAIEAVAE